MLHKSRRSNPSKKTTRKGIPKMINCTLTVIKSAQKENITASVSQNENGTFRSWNFTGKLSHVEGYTTKDGVNLDKEIVEVDAPTTILIFSESQGEAIYQRCAEIFQARQKQDDPNPAVNIDVVAKTIRVKETNILIVNVKQAYVDPETQIIDNSDSVLENLAKLKANSAANAAANAANNAPKPQVSAARAGLSRALGKGIKRIAKTYL